MIQRLSVFLACAATVAAGCGPECDEDGDCFGTTPICDIQQCMCMAACEEEADCADGYECNEHKFCSKEGEPVENECK